MRILVFLLLLAPLSAQHVDVGDLMREVKAEIRVLGEQGAAKAEYEAFVKRHGFTRLTYWDYLKNKVAFECCRDAGLWHVGYRITDREPNSGQVWRDWSRFEGHLRGPTSSAECDELSALYAVVAGRLGVGKIGLFWPTGNHTVAVWKVEGKRIVVPTTPIFLERDDGFDARGFDPTTQAVIYDYTAKDVAESFELPPRLVKFFARQVRDYGGASQELLHELRYLREAAWMGGCRKSQLDELGRRFTRPLDRRALERFERQFGRSILP